MSARPLIGISTNLVMETTWSVTPAYPRIAVAQDYVEGLLRCGAAPMLVPLFDPEGREEVLDQLVGTLDALVLSGGQDMDPSHYGQSRLEVCGEVLAERDRQDLALFAAARRRGIPVLGICRGMQVINVATGGTLHQDLPTQRPGEVVHSQTVAPTIPTHWVDFAPDGWLAQGLGRDGADVVSFHHQGVDRLGEGLVVEATAPDGLVEAYRGQDGAWLLAVQWHPEMSHREDAAGLGVIQLVVDAARR